MKLRSFIVVLVCVSVLRPAQQAAAQITDTSGIRHQLFTSEPPTGLERITLGDEVIGVQPVTVKVDSFSKLAPQSLVSIPVDGGDVLEGTVTKVDRRGENRCSVFGQIDGGGHFVLVLEKDAMAGRIEGPGHDVFTLRFIRDHTHVVQRIDESLMEICSGISGANREAQVPEVAPVHDPIDLVRDVLEEAGHDDAAARLAGSCSNTTDALLEVMIAYTHLARIEAGGTNAIVAQCFLGVDLTNLSYVNSLIDERMRLVWHGETFYDDAGEAINDALAALESAVGGDMDELHPIRAEYGADFMSLLASSAINGAGLGNCGPGISNSYSVLDWNNVSTFTFTHEIGHNLGCGHAAGDSEQDCSLWYANGWRWTGTDSVQYRSVMAYSPGTRVAQISNPNVSHMGQPTGVIDADNAFRINDVGWIGAGHVITKWDVWTDFDQFLAGEGTYSSPFNSIAAAVNHVPDTTNMGLEHPEVWILPSSTTESVTITKPMMLIPCNGPVVIGGS